MSSDKLPSIVRLGDQNLVRTDDGARPIEIKIRRIFTHPKYNQRNKEHNIALIELKEKVIFRDHIRPACLYQQQYFTGSVVAVNNHVWKLWTIKPKLNINRRDGGIPAGLAMHRAISWKYRCRQLIIYDATINFTQIYLLMKFLRTKYVLVEAETVYAQSFRDFWLND